MRSRGPHLQAPAGAGNSITSRRVETLDGRLTQWLECHLHTVEVTGSNPVPPTPDQNPSRFNREGFFVDGCRTRPLTSLSLRARQIYWILLSVFTNHNKLVSVVSVPHEFSGIRWRLSRSCLLFCYSDFVAVSKFPVGRERGCTNGDGLSFLWMTRYLLRQGGSLAGID